MHAQESARRMPRFRFSTSRRATRGSRRESLRTSPSSSTRARSRMGVKWPSSRPRSLRTVGHRTRRCRERTRRASPRADRRPTSSRATKCSCRRTRSSRLSRRSHRRARACSGRRARGATTTSIRTLVDAAVGPRTAGRATGAPLRTTGRHARSHGIRPTAGLTVIEDAARRTARVATEFEPERRAGRRLQLLPWQEPRRDGRRRCARHR